MDTFKQAEPKIRLAEISVTFDEVGSYQSGEIGIHVRFRL